MMKMMELSLQSKRGTSEVEGSRMWYPRPRSLDSTRKLVPLGMTGGVHFFNLSHDVVSASRHEAEVAMKPKETPR